MSERPRTAVPVGLLRPGRWCRHSAASAFRQPSTSCSTSLPAQHLWLSGLLSRRPHSLDLSPGFYPGPHHQCRLFQTFARNVFVRSILVHSARLRFLTITALCKSTYLLTYLLRQLRRVVAKDVRQRLVSALVFSRVDYCNSSLAGLPAGALAPLQRVLNAATRFVADLRPRDHVTVQRSLHWLPFRQRIQYKLCSDVIWCC